MCDGHDVCIERKGSLISNICCKHRSIKAWILPLHLYGETGTFMEKSLTPFTICFLLLSLCTLCLYT